MEKTVTIEEKMQTMLDLLPDLPDDTIEAMWVAFRAPGKPKVSRGQNGEASSSPPRKPKK
jgi:hypothetical protein